MDQADQLIIRVLRDDARISNTDLAKKLGLSEATVRRRISGLVKSGAIRRIGITEGGGESRPGTRGRRHHGRRDGGAERIPTKAGIACRVALLPEIIDALQQAEAQARARGLL